MSLLRFLRSTRKANESPPGRYRLEIVSAHPKPEDVKDGVLYVLKFDDVDKWAYLRCPCPRKDLIRLDLNLSRSPSWAVRVARNGLPTIYPSVWQWEGCYSHFWMWQGQVHWCRGSGKPPRPWSQWRNEAPPFDRTEDT